MDVSHQQLGLANEFTVPLPFDGSYRDSSAFVHIQAVGLSSVHLGMGTAVAHQGTLADLRVDAAGDEEGDVDVGILQFQRFIEAEQGVFGGTVSRT